MSTDLTAIADSANLPAALGPDLAAAVDLAKAEKALSTRKAYGTDFRLFKAWCEAKGVSSLSTSPETVAAFLAAETGNGTKPSTSRGVSPLSATPTSLRSSTHPRTQKPSRRRCGASGVPWAQPKYERLRL
jgi:hypothetical protein